MPKIKKGHSKKKCKVCGKEFIGSSRRVTCNSKCALKNRTSTKSKGFGFEFRFRY